jgi:hypothetical protein
VLTLYRVSRADGELIESFVSSYARNRPPRAWETRNVLIQMGLSTFVRRRQAEGVARRFPTIGDHVARLVLRHGYGIAYARTGPSGHVTIWAAH